MSRPSLRSAAERDMYYQDNTTDRNVGTEKVIRLEPPERIKDNPDKLDWWNYICNDLASRSLLSPSYFINIVILVDNIVNYHEVLAAYESSGPLVPVMNRDGESVRCYVENPLARMIERLQRIIISICNKFGLNPKDAVFVTNPDILTKQVLDAKTPDRKKITYFNA